MLEYCIIPYMSAMAGWAGGSLKGHDKFPATWIPEALFALPFAWALFPALQSLDINLYQSIVIKGAHYFVVSVPFEWAAAAFVWFWSYIWMQSAPGPALQWGRDPERGMARPRTLSPVVNWISDRLGFTGGDVNYCRLWMAVKGFLIGLPVGGIPLAIMWPLSYEIGNRLNSAVVSECLAGAGAGVSILIGMYAISSIPGF